MITYLVTDAPWIAKALTDILQMQLTDPINNAFYLLLILETGRTRGSHGRCIIQSQFILFPVQRDHKNIETVWDE